MSFSKLVVDDLGPELQNLGFKLVIQKENYVRFDADQVSIILVHNSRENSNTLYIGEDQETYAINDELLRTVFNTTVQLEVIPTEVFIKNIQIFLSNEGKRIATAPVETLKAIKNFVYEASRNYTDQLLYDQNLRAAGIAWEKKDYATFIDCLDKVDKAKLSKSYMIKYKMAVERVKGRV
ncbi:MAG TPA: hypothetical protein VK826_11050 [Bacteroidia bacterium]|nr:hypothetical protein [Bacteroidia bacterium]